MTQRSICFGTVNVAEPMRTCPPTKPFFGAVLAGDDDVGAESPDVPIAHRPVGDERHLGLGGVVEAAPRAGPLDPRSRVADVVVLVGQRDLVVHVGVGIRAAQLDRPPQPGRRARRRRRPPIRPAARSGPATSPRRGEPCGEQELRFASSGQHQPGVEIDQAPLPVAEDPERPDCRRHRAVRPAST